MIKVQSAFAALSSHLVGIVNETGAQRVAPFQLVVRKNCQADQTNEDVDAQKERDLKEDRPAKLWETF